MRKSFKALLLAAAFTAACASTAFAAAATGWIHDGNTWHYIDKYGENVTEDWAKSGTEWYYLDENGDLATDRLIDNGSNIYYVGEDGRMAANKWVKLEGEDDSEARWYYFQSSGKAVRAASDAMKTFTVNGDKYAFDEDGRMLYGFVGDNEMLEDDDSILTAEYYFGGADDGAMKTGWIECSDVDSTAYDNQQSLWFYFGTNGKKVADTEKTIDGRKYSFDANGVMISGWQVSTASGSTAKTIKYFSDEADGHLAKGVWIHAIPGADVDAEDYEEENYRWFYTDSKGSVYKDTTKKINNRWYVFDEVGRMKAGLVVLDKTATSGAKIDQVIDLENTTSEDILKGDFGQSLRFFSADEENDGSMKTGTVKIELADGEFTFVFTSTGLANHGVKNGKLYANGMLVTADPEYKYELKTNPVDDKIYLVNTSGSVLASGKTAKDADDYCYANHTGVIAKISGDNASKAATYFAKNGNLGSYEGKVSVAYYN